jgi:hypothetical protein
MTWFAGGDERAAVEKLHVSSMRLGMMDFRRFRYDLALNAPLTKRLQTKLLMAKGTPSGGLI